MKKFSKLNKLKEGDQVAVVSPSSGLPGLFPWVQDLGIKRITEEFGLIVKEYPTTREMGSSLEDRARDLMNAFSDEDNKAIIASIGGSDQIKLIKHLEPDVFLKNSKPFFGYSDNTHLHNFLWNLGIPSYYGSAVMTQFGMQKEMHSLTVDFIKNALFRSGEFELVASKEYNDIGLSWGDKYSLNKKREMEPNSGFYWDGSVNAQGILWGGCVESMIVQSTTGTYLPDTADLEQTVLYLETAEDIPEHWIIQYLLTGFGERGWFDKFQGVLIGRPKAWDFSNQKSATEKAEYSTTQRETVVNIVRSYNSKIPIVQNVDFGHTDPQIPIPSGGLTRIDSVNKKLFFTY